MKNYIRHAFSSIKKRTLSVSAVLTSIVLLLSAPAQGNSAAVADFVFTGGKVYTVNETQPWAEAVAVKGNKIIFVGSNSDAKKHIRKKTKIIKLDGKMMLPGFVEGHFHTIAGSMAMKGVNLQTDDKKDLFKIIRNYVAKSKDDVILGYGVRFNPWPDSRPTAAMLDAIESDRPVFFWGIDLHTAWVNSRALEMAGIDKNTPETVPGFSYFERDAKGNPTGWIVEVPALLQVFSALVDVNMDFVAEGLKEWLPRFSEAGITTVHDLGVQGFGQTEGYQLLADFNARGELPLRVSGTYYWNNPKVDPLPILKKMRKKFTTDKVRVEYLKINLDGSEEAWNGLFTQPFLDKPDIVPESIIPYKILNDVVQRADAMGINVVCHCYGDLAVRKLLDAIEAAIKVNPPRQRHHKITHGVQVHPDDRDRFAKLGVTYETHGAWMALDPVVQKMSAVRMGMDWVNRLYPIRAIADSGANISLGSDWPAAGYYSEYRPLAGIQMAVTRQSIGAPDSPVLGNKSMRLKLEQALRANTLGAAYGMNANSSVGSIEVGKFADLIVLEKNLFDVKTENISQVKVMMTLMDGKVTHVDERLK